MFALSRWLALVYTDAGSEASKAYTRGEQRDRIVMKHHLV
jgi:hypothetical protein